MTNFICNRPKLTNPFSGPYRISQTHRNNTVTLEINGHFERVNIRKLKMAKKSQNVVSSIDTTTKGQSITKELLEDVTNTWDNDYSPLP